MADKWTLTAASQARIPEWNKWWIENVILRTRPMDDEDRDIVARSIHGMYEAAHLQHDELRIVFVPSPMMGAMVAGGAAAWWHQRNSTAIATYAATRAATADATDAATAATTYATTYAATAAATDDATRAATDDIGAVLLRAVTSVVGDNELVRGCMRNSINLRHGGNQWASWCCFLSFVRDVVAWTHPSHANYAHYELCAMRAGNRFMHERFVIVCDFPLTLKTRVVNGAHQLHCLDGPATEWSDGWKLWCIDGIALDEQIVMRPETQTIEQIHAEGNSDARAIRIQRFGWPRYLRETRADCVDTRRNRIEGTREALFRTRDGEQRLVVTCPTGRVFAMGVPKAVATCGEAQRWLAHDEEGRLNVIART